MDLKISGVIIILRLRLNKLILNETKRSNLLLRSNFTKGSKKWHRRNIKADTKETILTQQKRIRRTLVIKLAKKTPRQSSLLSGYPHHDRIP